MPYRAFGIYIHIPYCYKKCDYCDFYSRAVSKQEISFEEIKQYILYLEKDLLLKKQRLFFCNKPIHPTSKNTDKIKNHHRLKTIFFGGGTPSILEPRFIKQILDFIYKHFDTKYLQEITLEANPESLTYEKIKVYQSIGINRLNVGVQSRNEKTLEYLGRYYSREKINELFNIIKKAQFKNYGIDIIYDIPNQQWEDIKKDLQWAISNEVTHISAYSLTVEKNTPLSRQIKSHKKKKQNESNVQNIMMSTKIKEYLEKHDFQQYEVSNFSKKGYQSYHNTLYWKNRPYIGLGNSAHSFFNFKRYENNTSQELLYENIQADVPLEHNKEITDLLPEDLFINGFRILSYQSFHLYKIYLKQIAEKKHNQYKGKYYYNDILDIFNQTFRLFEKRKYLKLFTNGFQITYHGLNYSDTMVSIIYGNFSEYEENVIK